MKIWTKLAAIVDAWDLKYNTDDNDMLGKVEHLLHEVSHAKLLGIETFERKTPEMIADALVVLNEPHDRHHEECAWAIEWLLLDTFKLRHRFSWKILAKEIKFQKGNVRTVRRRLKQPDIQWHAEQAAREIRRLARYEAP